MRDLNVFPVHFGSIQTFFMNVNKELYEWTNVEEIMHVDGVGMGIESCPRTSSPV